MISNQFGLTWRDMTHPDQLALDIEAELVSKHGPLLPPSVLPTLLGYRSIDAYRKAVSRHTVPVAIFKLENRRGSFALAKDVARWLSQRRHQATEPMAPTKSSPATETSVADDRFPARAQAPDQAA